MPAPDLFLKITGIEGDVTDPAHAGAIALQSFSWNELAGAAATVGGVRRPSTAAAMFFSAVTSGASEPLFLACAKQTILPGANLTLRTPGPPPVAALRIFFGPLTIESYVVSDSSGDAGSALEQFAIRAARIRMHVTPRTAAGTAGTPVDGGWDFFRHAPL
jgi:type VI secretion system secreted protein Hcp